MIYSAKILENNKLTEDTFQLVLDIETDNFEFIAGQFVVIENDFDGKLVKRAYSISIAPGSENRFELTIKKVDGGIMSSWLSERKDGDLLQLSGPFGEFVDELATERKIVLIAIGCGVAPIKSIAESLLKKTDYAEISFYFGNKYAGQIPYLDILKDWQNNDTRFKLFLCVTRSENIDSCMHNGRVFDVMSQTIDDYSQRQYFICGSREMIKDANEYLGEKGVLRKNIFNEIVVL